jgi:5'-3' exonuclease
MDVYRTVIGKNHNDSLVGNGKIKWEMVHLFVKSLAKQEYGHFLEEYKVREKWEKEYNIRKKGKEEGENYYDNYPILHREKERYISVSKKGWKERYYRSVMGVDGKKENIRKICMNYLEGLEWVYRYYTEECAEWRWKYNWNYGPLMEDLEEYVLEYKEKFMKAKNNPYTKEQQLAYVLPREKLWLYEGAENLLETRPENYPEKYEMEGAFCRYGWEMKPILPEIEII